MSHEKRIRRLREAGYKLTNARLAVLRVLEEAGEHMTSADVLEAVREIAPDVGRASVFRTLDLLTQLSIIRPTYIESSATPHYVMMPDGHHHHIICTLCKSVIEFDDCGLSDLTNRLETQFAVQIRSHLLEFYGICQHCRDQDANGSDDTKT